MAETIGFAISIVSITAQVLDCAVKLHNFWGSVKDAPEEVLNLIDEIETLSDVFAGCPDLNFGSASQAADASILRCLGRCQKEMNSLSHIVDKHYHGISKRKRWGSLKLNLKKEILSSHIRSLERAKTMLILAQQLHFRQMISPNLRSICLRIYLLGSSHVYLALVPIGKGEYTTPPPAPTQYIHHATTKPPIHPSDGDSRLNKRREQKFFRIWAQLPSWITTKAWEIQASQAYSGWMLNFRVYNVIADDSLLFQYVWCGDIQGIQELLSTQSATPFDCNKFGQTALHFAASAGELAICRLLLDNGADPNVRDCRGMQVLYTCYLILAPLGYANSFAGKWITMTDTSSLRDLYLMFTMESTLDMFLVIDNAVPMGAGYAGPPDVLSIIYQRFYPSYRNFPLKDRFELAMNMDTWSIRGTTANVLEVAMGGTIEPSAYHLHNQYNETLLFIIVRCLAMTHSVKSPEQGTASLPGWRKLLADAIKAGADSCSISTRWMTSKECPGSSLLLEFISCYTRDHGRTRVYQYNFTQIVRLWVAELANAGVDLLSYGERTKIFKSRRRYLPYHLTGLIYGPTPDDWQVWASNPLDELAGEFWNLVEKPEERMPGSWIE
ncbi:hypothetical protein F5884DRAFT_827109 [Xylogone sp. PMI_703]|nr:hypothetical protein F5884DRAFT_827109 [Xylogone sp. PMI_703]